MAPYFGDAGSASMTPRKSLAFRSLSPAQTKRYEPVKGAPQASVAAARMATTRWRMGRSLHRLRMRHEGPGTSLKDSEGLSARSAISGWSTWLPWPTRLGEWTSIHQAVCCVHMLVWRAEKADGYL